MNNTDEANKIIEADLLGAHANNNQLLPRDPEPIPSVNDLNADVITSNLAHNMKFHVITLLCYLAKITASAIILANASETCTDLKTGWIIMMIVHDFFECCLVIGLINIVFKVQNSPRSNSSQRNVQQNSRQGSAGRDLENNMPSQVRAADPAAIALAREVTSRNKLIKNLAALNLLYYLGIFIYGQVLLFIMFDDGCPRNQYVWNLMLAYIIMGYVYIFRGVVVLILFCICCPYLPCIFCILILLIGPNPRTTPATKDVIKNLKVKDYTGDLVGEHQCSICIEQYKPGEKIIELPCNNMHHFHQQCIVHWLEINGECPLCRTKIGNPQNN